MSTQTVALSELSIAAINVRKTRAGAEPLYAASIRAKGVIEPLIVRKNGVGYTITNGGKRYAALMFLRDNNQTAKGERVTDNYPVGILVREESDAEARDTSLTTNLVRSDMHPVDLHQAFVDLINDGKSEADIAAEYLMTDREVKQVLALGQLSPKVLEAWKAEKIGAEVAKAFTLAPDLKSQERTFERLQKEAGERHQHHEYKGLIQEGDVKKAFKANANDAGKFIEFVGVEAYVARGGKVTEHLFGHDHTASNPKLAKQMAEEKIEQECEALVRSGWSWAKPKAGLRNEHSYGEVAPKTNDRTETEARRLRELDDLMNAHSRGDEYEKAEAEHTLLEESIKARGYTEEQKKRCGCFVSITETGKLLIECGKTLPKEKEEIEKAEKAEAKKEKKKATGGKPNLEISHNLISKLSRQLTAAAADAIAANPVVALPAVISGFLSYSDSGPIDVTQSAYGTRSKFPAVFEKIQKLKPAEQLHELAKVAGPLVNMNVSNTDRGPLRDPINVKFCELLGAPLYSALKKHFDAKEYFSSVNGHICRQKLREMFGKGYQEKWEAEKKGALEKTAVTKARETGWLPPELRTSFYTGPSAKPEDLKPPKAKPVQKAKPASARKTPAKKRKKISEILSPTTPPKPWSPFGSH